MEAEATALRAEWKRLKQAIGTLIDWKAVMTAGDTAVLEGYDALLRDERVRLVAFLDAMRRFTAQYGEIDIDAQR